MLGIMRSGARRRQEEDSHWLDILPLEEKAMILSKRRERSDNIMLGMKVGIVLGIMLGFLIAMAFISK